MAGLGGHRVFDNLSVEWVCMTLVVRYFRAAAEVSVFTLQGPGADSV